MIMTTENVLTIGKLDAARRQLEPAITLALAAYEIVHVVSKHRSRFVDKTKWIGMGISIGIVFGAAIHNIGVGMLFGIALGAGIAAVKARSEGR
jgi:hypothetical protein